jgi:murein L,D-transpeptidase YafK
MTLLEREIPEASIHMVRVTCSRNLLSIFIACTVLCWPLLPAGAADFPLADKILVEKGKRKLHLLLNGEAFRTYDIALGVEPVGDKEREGDQKTPEGVYKMDERNPNSDYFLSIHVSYPNQQERQEAQRKGINPGGQIMIHGQPNTPTYSAAYYRKEDWTNGCIAVSNSDMIDIWLMTPDDVPIEILP